MSRWIWIGFLVELEVDMELEVDLELGAELEVRSPTCSSNSPADGVGQADRAEGEVRRLMRRAPAETWPTKRRFPFKPR